MRSLVFASLLAVTLSGCVGAGVEFGDTARTMDVPTAAFPCEHHRLTRTNFVKPQYPDDAMLFYIVSQREGQDDITLEFDVAETGDTANIRFVGPQQYLRHATRQKLIRASADAIAQWKYDWEGSPRYVEGCRFTIQFETEGVTDYL